MQQTVLQLTDLLYNAVAWERLTRKEDLFVHDVFKKKKTKKKVKGWMTGSPAAARVVIDETASV